MRSRYRRIRMAWDRLSVRQQGAIVVAIPSVCLIVTLAAWIWSRQALISLRRQIDYSEAIVMQTDSLFAALVSAEAGVRGYSLTRQSEFLTPYRQTQTEFSTIFNQFKQALQLNPEQYKKLQDIQNLAQQALNSFEQTVALANDEPSAAQANELNQLLTEGRMAMEQIRVLTDEIQISEQRILNVYNLERQEVLSLTALVLWLTALISLISFLAAIYLFSRLDRELGQRELMLQESKSLLQAIVSNVVDGVLTLDRFGRIEIFNPAAAQMFGYEAEEVIGHDLALLLEDSTRQTDQPSTAATSRWANTWQTKGLRKVGSPFPVQVSVSDVQLDDRQIVIIRDTTEFEQAETKLQARADELMRLTAVLAQTNAVLESRNRELEQFAYVASHDLKAPLRAISNLSEWLEEDLAGQLPVENKQQMQLLRGRVLRMEALINGLLEYSRVGRSRVELEEVSVHDLLIEIIDSLAPPDSFSIEIAPNMPTFTTKRVLLRQVFANLIGNAFKHHPHSHGHIQISVQDQGTHYEFGVADDGVGIAPEYHNKVFVMFQTLEARDTKESTGIGLSIVKKVVETEGGTIRLESQEGLGSAFYFTWLKNSTLRS